MLITVPSSKFAQLSLLGSGCDGKTGKLAFFELVAVEVLVVEELFKFLFKATAVEAQLSVSPKPLSLKFVLVAKSLFMNDDWNPLEG